MSDADTRALRDRLNALDRQADESRRQLAAANQALQQAHRDFAQRENAMRRLATEQAERARLLAARIDTLTENFHEAREQLSRDRERTRQDLEQLEQERLRTTARMEQALEDLQHHLNEQLEAHRQEMEAYFAELAARESARGSEALLKSSWISIRVSILHAESLRLDLGSRLVSLEEGSRAIRRLHASGHAESALGVAVLSELKMQETLRLAAARTAELETLPAEFRAQAGRLAVRLQGNDIGWYLPEKAEEFHQHLADLEALLTYTLRTTESCQGDRVMLEDRLRLIQTGVSRLEDEACVLQAADKARLDRIVIVLKTLQSQWHADHACGEVVAMAPFDGRACLVLPIRVESVEWHLGFPLREAAVLLDDCHGVSGLQQGQREPLVRSHAFGAVQRALEELFAKTGVTVALWSSQPPSPDP